VHGIDYDETFSLVENMDFIPLELSIAVANGWEVHHMDLKNAFFHGNLSEDIYGVALGIYVGFLFGLSIEEIFLWPQAGSEGMVCQYGLLPIVK
jgi:hypothetical protein